MISIRVRDKPTQLARGGAISPRLHIVLSLLARWRHVRQTPSRSNCDSKNTNVEMCELTYNTRHFNDVYKQLYFYWNFPVILIWNSTVYVNLIYAVAIGCVYDVTRQ